MKSPIDGGVVCITGASSGIGREIARQVAGRAKALVLIARRAERLHALAEELKQSAPNVRVECVACDLTATTAVSSALVDVTSKVGPIDVLINNAGTGDQELFDRGDWATYEKMIATNITAGVYLVRQVLPAMIARHSGGLLHVGSGAGVMPMVGSAVYSGTKHFLHGFASALRLELAGTGVRSTEALPGPVDTEFDQVAGIQGMVGGPPQGLRIGQRSARVTPSRLSTPIALSRTRGACTAG